MKSKLRLYHVLLTTRAILSEKNTLTVVEMQQLSDIEKTDSKEKFPCLKWTIYNGRWKVCVNFKTDTDNSILSFAITGTVLIWKIMSLNWCLQNTNQS